MTLLKGKTAIVTGAGHPMGIGRAIALKLAGQGANVAITDVQSVSGLDDLAREISDLSGEKCIGIHCDITSKEDIVNTVKQTRKDFSHIDILVNNAGVGGKGTKFMEIDQDSWDLSYAVNIKGTVNFCRTVIPFMLEQGSGVIINNSSLCGLGAIEAIPASYTSTKFAIVGLTKAIALEYAAQGIRCNAVCPGVVNTAMRQNAIGRIAKQHNISVADAESLEDESIAMKRAAEPGEIADAVAYLAGPAASYITGVALPVAGGMSAGL